MAVGFRHLCLVLDSKAIFIVKVEARIGRILINFASGLQVGGLTVGGFKVGVV